MKTLSKVIASTVFTLCLAVPFASQADFLGIATPLGSVGVGASSYRHCGWVNGHYVHYRGHRHWVSGYRIC